MQNQTQGGGGRGRRGNNGGILIAPGGTGTVGLPAPAGAYRSKITKAFANWNVCYSCGFDIEDGHTFHMPTYMAPPEPSGRVQSK
jgi:hypothetical protein